MSKAFYDMVYLFACGARGKIPAPITDMDVLKVYDAAQSQGVWHTVFLALKHLYDRSELTVDKDRFDKWHQKVMYQIVRITRRNMAVENTIKMLEKNGIECCVLKGEVMAQLYHNPTCRVSSDTDILIDKDLEKKAVELLKSNDFTVKARPVIKQHFECWRADTGLIEVHVQLSDEISTHVWFNDENLILEEYRKINSSQGNNIKTLGITDGLVFTVLHYIKHFLANGAGIRQLMDILLYIRRYKNEIDWDRFNKLMKDLKYDKFIDNSIGIGLKYLEFKKGELPIRTYDEDIIKRLLEDMEAGGMFGKNEEGRQYFNREYTSKRVEKYKKDSDIKRVRKHMLFNLIFPNRERLIKKYPYLRNSKLLLPVAWMHRNICLFIDIIMGKKSLKVLLGHKPDMYNDLVERRMKLIRDLDMI